MILVSMAVFFVIDWAIALVALAMFPTLMVLDKENGKKADALNAGVNASRKDVICNVDSDSWLEPNILQQMLRAFVEDEKTIAVGGIVRIANGSIFDRGQLIQTMAPKSFLGKIQVVEYLRSFLFGRIGWSSIDGLIIISGAFAVFDRAALIETGGYKLESIGEDIEVIVNMHHHFTDKGKPYSMRYLPEPVCWTKVPEKWNQLSAQRNRWQRGLADTLFNHRKMIGNPKYGWLGMFSLPFHMIFELLGPLLELLSYLLFFILMVTGLLDAKFAILFILFAVLYGVILSIGSVLLDELTYKPYTRLRDVFSITIHAFFENFGFRQLHFWWRLRGLFDYLRKNKEWNITDRNPKLTNTLHWLWFGSINLFFVALLFYGLVL
jgi:cellulose synthase/poly-beta-1,6-N-acetylglucosamine synthase-like glycosyltransferase